jgi:hypothetical protein
MEQSVAAGILLTVLALVFTEALALAVLAALSLPLVLLDCPPHLGWSNWPSVSHVR